MLVKDCRKHGDETMNWPDRLLLTFFMGGFLALCYLMFFDQQKKNQNFQRINSKLIIIQDMTNDLRDLAKNLQVKNAVANIQFDNNPEIYLMEKTYKMALISDVIESKAAMMRSAIEDAINELKK